MLLKPFSIFCSAGLQASRKQLQASMQINVLFMNRELKSMESSRSESAEALDLAVHQVDPECLR